MKISDQQISLFFKLSISITVFSALFAFVPPFLTIFGVVGMIAFLGIQLYRKKQKVALDYARLLLIASFSGHCAVAFFNGPYAHITTLLMKLALMVFLLLYIRKIISSLQELTQSGTLLSDGLGGDSISYLLADIAAVYIVVAALFKILHWEIGILNSNLLLVIGFCSALVSILTSSRSIRN